MSLRGLLGTWSRPFLSSQYLTFLESLSSFGASSEKPAAIKESISYLEGIFNILAIAFLSIEAIQQLPIFSARSDKIIFSADAPISLKSKFLAFFLFIRITM